MAKISIATVRALINFLSEPNNSPCFDSTPISRTKLLAELGLSELHLNQSIQLIDSSKYEVLFFFAERELHSNSVGFDFGKAITIDRWGILGYIAFTPPTLNMALTKQRKYQSLAGNLSTSFSEVVNDDLLLKSIPAYHCSHHVVEEIITGWATLTANLSQNKIKPKAMYFHHSYKGNNDDEHRYKDFFGCYVFFEHDFNGIQIKQTSLDIPLITANCCRYVWHLVYNIDPLVIQIYQQSK